MTLENVTLNPNDMGLGHVLSNGNLTDTANKPSGIRATHGKTKGKWYWEFKIDSGNVAVMIGVANKLFSVSTDPSTVTGNMANFRVFYNISKVKYPENTPYGIILSAGDVVGVALNMDIGTLEFFINGISQGISHSNLLLLGEVFPYFYAVNTATRTFTVNFGATPFAYPTPIGYLPYAQMPPIKKMSLKNPSTNQHYSLAEKTLIPLPDTSNKNMISFGVETGKEIKLDEDFDKISYPVEGVLRETVGIMVKPLSIKFE